MQAASRGILLLLVAVTIVHMLHGVRRGVAFHDAARWWANFLTGEDVVGP